MTVFNDLTAALQDCAGETQKETETLDWVSHNVSGSIYTAKGTQSFVHQDFEPQPTLAQTL